MGDHNRNDHELNFPFIAQNETIDTTRINMSIIAQPSSRPNTLSIDGQRNSNTALFTPGDYTNLLLSTPELDNRLRGYTTPDLINAFVMSTSNVGQPSLGAHMLEEIVPNHIDNNNHPILSTMTSFDPTTYKIVSNTDNRQHENISTYHSNRSNSQTSPYNPSISSLTMDNESSNSTTPSSPLSMNQQYPRVKDELQHVPSIRTKHHGEPNDVVRKEKKRERNRQAAQKCRTRKLTRIAELQKRVNELQGKNKDLSNVAECLKSDITSLEKKLCDHHAQGCVLMNGSML
ncbi:unnamed protein product [Rotaria sordida]|uniref:BZIP domain-containing protein n=1 Tax=Rotaria sordida TaxID=392033 RepID=A0A814NHX1_9BILA|nr:unnamed protein product [Rotaria sordida]CAF1037326.1 unnamed protein product [Rotaria sordida]CAF1092346.1 unnamed protein product [Rotaria sordida]CAF1110683.1 unnamed protein product [Rotaria sordida]CAF1112183.1 unnamed protein product [Rotaria sordida]